SETPPVTASAPLSIVISPGGGGNPGALSGNYAFYLNGFTSSGAWTLAGSFISDGNSHITSGVVDGNSVTGQPFNATVSGTYWIAANGLNTITIQGQSFGPATFAFVLDSSANGRIIRYDDTTGQGSRGSGVLRKQDPNAFSLSRFTGPYVYGMTGIDPSGPGGLTRAVIVGQFTLSAGNFNGACDINDGGQFSTCTFTGTMSAIDPQTGRTLVQSRDQSGGVSHTAMYVVSASEAVIVAIDPAQSGGIEWAGSVLQQSGTFNNGSLNGLSVFYGQDIRFDSGSPVDESQAVIISFDGNGNWNITASDDDLGGTITQGQPEQGTYTVQSNGAITLSQTGHHGLDGFLVSQNRFMTVDSGSKAGLEIFEPQTGGPFSNASIAGTYAGGSLVPLDYANARNEVDVGSADGAGNLTTNTDGSSHKGLGQTLGQIHNYTIAANGRGTSSDNPPVVFYVISPSKWLVLLTDTDAAVLVFEH
ncbi:MAG: hypothetical protein ACHP8B_15710, partial [Terriglobales bacterium]